MLLRKRLKLPASRAFDLDAHIAKCFGHLRRTIEVDIWRLAEERELQNARCQLALQLIRQHLVGTLEIDDQSPPTMCIKRHSRKLHRCNRKNTFKLELRNFLQLHFPKSGR